MHEKQKKDIMNVLVMLSVDGNIAQEEKAYVNKLKDKFEISDSDFQELLREFRDSSRKMSIPKGEEGRDTFKLLIEAAEADGAIDDAEQHLLQRVADHVGLSEMEAQSLIPGIEESVSEVYEKVDELYEQFHSWDSDTRVKKLEEIKGYGSLAVVSLLQVLESYRVPDGASDNLELKKLVAIQLGQLNDRRAVYYLAQQVNIGDVDDEISDEPLRMSCAEAVENIVGQKFEGDDKLAVLRQWWMAAGKDDYSDLAI